MSEYNVKQDYSKYKVPGYPVRHRRKIPFEPKLTMDLETRSMIRDIRFKDNILDGYILSAYDYLDLVQEAYASNIHWSTKIEGNELSLEQVRDLTREYIAGCVTKSPNGPTQEILNHLNSALSRNMFSLPWTLKTVLDIHDTLMEGVGECEPGVIRTEEVSVYSSDGIELFRACPASSVTEELTNLIEWVNESPFDEVVTATLFFHEFESIHPFEDGNGRTGRVLFQGLLNEMGLRNCSLCKFEEKLLSDTRTYYDLLRYTDLFGNYTPLVRYVTESLLSSYEEAVEVFSEKDRIKDMEENTRKLAIMSKQLGFFSLRTAVQQMNLGEQSVRSKLEDLVEMGIIEKVGYGRGMKYVFNDPFRQLHDRISSESDDEEEDDGSR